MSTRVHGANRLGRSPTTATADGSSASLGLWWHTLRLRGRKPARAKGDRAKNRRNEVPGGLRSLGHQLPDPRNAKPDDEDRPGKQQGIPPPTRAKPDRNDHRIRYASDRKSGDEYWYARHG